jgi:hypothetical protein
MLTVNSKIVFGSKPSQLAHQFHNVCHFRATFICGFGGYFQGKWFSDSWPPEFKHILESEMSMAFRELYSIVVAAVLWEHFWSTKRIVFYCDNESTVHK